MIDDCFVLQLFCNLCCVPIFQPKSEDTVQQDMDAIGQPNSSEKQPADANNQVENNTHHQHNRNGTATVAGDQHAATQTAAAAASNSSGTGCPSGTSAPIDPKSLQSRHSQIIQQYSSSTDEGCDTDHGEMDDAPPSAAACATSTSLPTPSIQRLNSYASSSSSSGVVTNFHTKSLSQNLSCESSRSNFSTLESLDLNLSDCSDLAGSLPSCASSSAQTTIDTTVMDGE